MKNDEWITFRWTKGFVSEDYLWARAYLAGKGVLLPGPDMDGRLWLPLLANNPTNREIESKLRNAWRQRKARKKLTGKKGYNFILSNVAKRKLDRIASEMHTSINGALANVIELETVRIQDHQDALKDFKAKLKAEKKAFSDALAKEASTANALRYNLNVVQGVVDRLCMQLALASEQLANPMSQHAPEDSLKAQALERYSELRAEARREMGLASLSVPAPDNANHIWEQINSSDQK